MFLQPLMLFGLAALAIPIIIHLLNRRRYEVVDWGAMRFLQMSKVTRRRVFIEEILLMLLRMALLALLALAFARLIWGGDWLARLQTRPNRDVVLIFDGSSSMNYTGGGKTPQDAAKEWAAEYVKGLVPGDGVAVFQARQQSCPSWRSRTTTSSAACRSRSSTCPAPAAAPTCPPPSRRPTPSWPKVSAASAT